jgi:translocation and assembly module TamB
MTLEGWRPGVYRFAVAGREATVAPFEGLRTAWDADLELVGQGERAQLRGEARLLQGTYAGQLSLLSLLLSERRERPASPAFALPLRIQLRLNNNLRVETNLAKLRVGGTLSLEGTTADPILFGSLESREGRITFRKNRYDVIAAAVRFTDPRKIDPILDITGRTRIKEYDVTVRLTGRPDELSVRLSSTPPLGEEELLLLTALGLTKEEAGRSPAGVAAGQVAQLLLEELLGPEVGEYGLDVFEVQTADTGEKKQTTVRVGKQVTEDLRILYSQSIAGASKRVLRVEYQIIGPLFLAGEQNFEGGIGGDVLLRFRFR